MRWNDATITHNRLGLRIAEPNPTNPTSTQVMAKWTHFIENIRTEINEIWYGHYATGVQCKIIIFNFPFSLTPTREMLEFVRWHDNATPMILYVRASLTYPNPTQPSSFKSNVRLEAFHRG
jgi:hypothetical protein